MNKLLQLWDKYILLFGVIFTALFVVLYPKLPSIHITYTWVYIRLEDFSIAALGFIWLIQVIRRKVKLALPLGIPILIYWLVGIISTVYAILFIGPHLTGFFPKIAALEYIRRIEYMILFFIGYSVVRKKDDIKIIIKLLFFGMGAIIVYGLGQHFYPYFWKYLPQFIQKTNFCFPSFQTGNEEFAKGIPLCLPVGSRVTSTFGGHYDLAGYLVIMLPIVLGVWFLVKKKLAKISLGILFVTGLITLILTSSRSAFIAYIVAVIIPLFFLKKKKWIAPILLLSILCLFLFSESTIQRFAQTFRITSVVVNMQGQIVGTTENGLSTSVQNQLAKNKKAIQANQVVQGVIPEGSSFITLPQKRVATSSAIVKQNLSNTESEKLKLTNGGLQLSTVQGDFSVQKVLVYDISVTTRLQAEWPHAISAFLQSPLLGTGYSTLTLAVDNDYLRLLGESGILGFLTFISVFVFLGIFFADVLPDVDNDLTKVFAYGLVGGVIGLFVNASLFDIFEASKVAETLWIVLGIGAGSFHLYQKKKVPYFQQFSRLITTKVFLYVYLFAIPFVLFWSSLNNFFIGDDFVWLKWAATSTYTDMQGYFTSAGGFFYRPLDKLLMLLFYSVFSFTPQGYHVIILFLYGLLAIGVYVLAHILFKQKVWAFAAAVLFLLLPLHGENIFWISSLSIDLSAVCMLFGLLTYIKSNTTQMWKAVILYCMTLLFALLGLLSYELAVIFPLFLLIADGFITRKPLHRRWILYIPFVVFDILYGIVRVLVHAVSAGGDYGYNLSHSIANIVGNIVGYCGLFIAGEWSLPVYTFLRQSTKAYVLPISLGILILFVIGIFFLRKIHWKHSFQKYAIVMFGILFSLIALLPYLPLGNIAQRYGYLSSVGFVILVMYCVKSLYQKIILQKFAKITIGIIICFAIFAVSFVGIKQVENEWDSAAIITYNTLAYFKVHYPFIADHTTFIFLNKPIQYKNAWVFPVGLPEGLWFLYEDNAPTVLEVSRVQEAYNIAYGQKNTTIFSFDSIGELTKIR